jgi:hypothetical protein
LEEGKYIVVGSRYLSNSNRSRPMPRLAVSLFYNFVKRLFNSRINDYPCGFKGFSCWAVNFLLPKTR